MEDTEPQEKYNLYGGYQTNSEKSVCREARRHIYRRSSIYKVKKTKIYLMTQENVLRLERQAS